MIADKIAYRTKCADYMNRKVSALDARSVVRALKEKYGDVTLGELEDRLDTEIDSIESECREFTKEEDAVMSEIFKKYSYGQVEACIARGYDTVDMVNAYLNGEMDTLTGKE